MTKRKNMFLSNFPREFYTMNAGKKVTKHEFLTFEISTFSDCFVAMETVTIESQCMSKGNLFIMALNWLFQHVITTNVYRRLRVLSLSMALRKVFVCWFVVRRRGVKNLFDCSSRECKCLLIFTLAYANLNFNEKEMFSCRYLFMGH